MTCRPYPLGQYKYIVDGRWCCSPEDPTVRDARGELNNTIQVAADATVTVFYKAGTLNPTPPPTRARLPVAVVGGFAPDVETCRQTGWDSPRLAVRDPTSPLDEDGQPVSGEVPFSTTGRGLWKSVSVPAAQAGLGLGAALALPLSPGAPPAPPALEFVIADGFGNFDTPPGGGAYRCPRPGGYKLERGRLVAFPRAREPPIMVVSDLDGTMVGDGPEFDRATWLFQQYWENSAALASSVLVFNTGRSIGSVRSLLEEKKGCLAMPDTVITAVGTKIFVPEHLADGSLIWKEDEAWRDSLDAGWDLRAVQAAASAVIQAHEGRCAWLDRGTEHPHRCALSVEVATLPAVVARLEQLLHSAGVDAKIIVSGAGPWRYMDCVAGRAGKLEALEYVRRRFKMPSDRTVACGDSGNDQLMLAGKHRSIIVGNAQSDLLAWHLEQPQNGTCIVADGHGAHGILEGLARLQLY